MPEDHTFVPGQRRRPEPLYAWFGLSAACGVGVPLGTAAEALDAAMIGSSRSYVFDTLGEMFASIQSGREPSLERRARWAGAVVHTGTTCRDAAQLLVDTVGSGALRRSSPLHRQLRDLNMIAQHGLTQRRVWEWSGALFFGKQPPVAAY